MTEALFHSNIPVAPGAQVYLERPRIDQLLDKALASPVVSVSAGTGYGKSYAVYSFVKRRNVRTVWIQLSGRDNIGEHFWENFISAISSVNREVADSFSRMNFPVTDQQLERYRRIPQSKMAPGEKYIFVFDDLYLISEKAVLRFLEYSIARIFPGVTSIIISRTEPQLNLMRMESKGLLARITEDQLRFTQEEMVSYFYLLDVNPIPQIVDTVYKDTEGWAFAIHLAGLFFKNGEAERAGGYVPSAIRPNIFKLIESEVMAPLPEALQRFLVKLSLIERLAPELLDAIARTLDGGSGEDPGGEDAGSNLIAQMEAIGSYIRFDIYLNAYRIHHLFLDYLTGRQGSLSEQEKQDVWKKAAAWSEANNQKMDAITYYDKAGDYDGMVRLFYTLPQALPARMAQFVIDILDHSPPDIYRQYPINIVFRGRALISLGRLDQSREELLEALPTLEALPESHQKHRILLGCNINLGFMGLITAMYTKNYDFVNCFRRAFEESRLIGDYVYKPPINGCSLPAYACMVMDRQPLELEKALSFIREVIPYVASAIGGCMSGMYELARGEYAFFRGDFAAAEIYLQEGLRRGREHDQYEIENRALFYLLRIYLSRADTKIKEILKQLKAELEQPLFINRYAYYDIITAWYYIQTGEPERTAAWLKNDYEESGLGDLTKGLEKLVRAKYYLRAKRCPAALATLENRGDAGPFLFGNIEIKVLEAVCRYQMRDAAGAFGALEEAYRLTEPAGLFFPFAELGKDMRTLSAAALKQEDSALPRSWLEQINREASHYAKKLFFAVERNKDGQTTNRGRSLSRRETEVLKRLSEGFTREEIARVSAISVNTVKSAIRSVYNKLGAVNRADAVRIATERNIL